MALGEGFGRQLPLFVVGLKGWGSGLQRQGLIVKAEQVRLWSAGRLADHLVDDFEEALLIRARAELQLELQFGWPAGITGSEHHGGERFGELLMKKALPLTDQPGSKRVIGGTAGGVKDHNPRG